MASSSSSSSQQISRRRHRSRASRMAHRHIAVNIHIIHSRPIQQKDVRNMATDDTKLQERGISRASTLHLLVYSSALSKLGSRRLRRGALRVEARVLLRVPERGAGVASMSSSLPPSPSPSSGVSCFLLRPRVRVAVLARGAGALLPRTGFSAAGAGAGAGAAPPFLLLPLRSTIRRRFDGVAVVVLALTWSRCVSSASRCSCSALRRSSNDRNGPEGASASIGTA